MHTNPNDMNIDKVISVFYSPTHTSAKTARAVASGISVDGKEEIDLTCDEATGRISFYNSLVVIAAPVYAGRVAPTARKRLERLHGNNTPAILIAVYGNRDYDDALVEMQDMAEQQGFIPISAGAFIGEHSFSRPGRPVAEGRPDDADLLSARRFGEESYRKLCNAEAYARLHVKGNRPYRTVSPSPAVSPQSTDSCVACGECIDVCPTHAISTDGSGGIATDATKCTKCCACVKVCPNNARVFDTPATQKLYEMCSTRREPELFF